MSNLELYDPIYIEEESDDEDIAKMKQEFRQYRKQIKKLERQYRDVLRRKKIFGLKLLAPLTRIHQ